ncbi:MAG TPA: hypothetical protein VMW53_03130 [archaeon]|nr:hypothetical protein [archaeon]
MISNSSSSQAFPVSANRAGSFGLRVVSFSSDCSADSQVDQGLAEGMVRIGYVHGLKIG